MAEDTQTVQVEEQALGKLSLSIKSPTPMWATWAFRIQFCFNKAFLFWVTSVDMFNAAELKTIIATCAAIDLFVWGIGRSIGVKPPETNAN